MTDLVQRLRGNKVVNNAFELCFEAADRIEQLENLCDERAKTERYLLSRCRELSDEAGQLREQNTYLDGVVAGLEREFAELNAVRKALRAALAKPEQSEPYIYYDPDTGETWTVGAIEDGCRSVDGLIALYAAPPAQTPVPQRRVTYVCPVCAASLERQEWHTNSSHTTRNTRMS